MDRELVDLAAMPPSDAAAPAREGELMLAEQQTMHGFLLPRLGAPPSQFPTSLDYTTQTGKRLLMLALQPATIKISKEGSAKILAQHYLIRKDSGTNEETGEVGEFYRTYFLNELGESYMTTSPYALQTLAAMMLLYDRDQWDKGIPLVIRSVASERKGRFYHRIELDSCQ